MTLELAYVIGANFVLRHLLIDLAEARGFELRIRGMLSVLPGRIKFERLELRAARGTLLSAVAEHGEARFRVPDLARGQLGVTLIRARELHVTVRHGAGRGDGARFDFSAGETRASGSASVRLGSAPDPSGRVEIAGTLAVDELAIEEPATRSRADGLRAKLVVERAALSRTGWKLAGQLSGSGPDFGAAVELLTHGGRGPALAELAGKQPFSIDTRLRHGQNGTRFAPVLLESNGSRCHGELRFDSEGAHGAFLLRRAGLSLGLAVTPRGTSAALGADERWLTRQIARLGP